MKKIGILSHYCTFTTPRPSKAISSTYEESWHVVSLLKTYRPVLWHLESCFWNVFPSLTKNTLKIWTKLKDWFIEIFQPSFRYTSIRWTHAQYCHLESFLKFPTPRPATKQGDKNCSTYEESYITCGVICAHLPSSTLQSNTFNIWMELTCWVVVMNLTHLSPYRTLNMLFLPCNKIIRWTNEEHAHLVSFLNFCPHSTLQRNTFNIWNKLTCRVILETYPPPTLQSERFNIWRKFTYVFPQTGLPVYLYGVLTPFKGLHTWAAWFYVCLPLVFHLSLILLGMLAA